MKTDLSSLPSALVNASKQAPGKSVTGLHEFTAAPIWGPFLLPNIFPQLIICLVSALLILQGHGVILVFTLG